MEAPLRVPARVDARVVGAVTVAPWAVATILLPRRLAYRAHRDSVGADRVVRRLDGLAEPWRVRG